MTGHVVATHLVSLFEIAAARFSGVRRFVLLATSYVAERLILYAALIVPAILNVSQSSLGQLELLLATVGLAMAVAPLGLDESIKLEIFRRSRPNLALASMTAILAGVAVGIAASLVVPGMVSVGTAAIVAGVAAGSRISRERARVAANLRPLAFGSILSVLTFGVSVIALGSLVEAVSASIIALALSYTVLSVSLTPGNLSDAQAGLPPSLPQMLRFGSPLIVAGLAMWGIAAIDRYMISGFLELSDVAEYGIAYRTVALLTGAASMGIVWWRSESFRNGYEWSIARLHRFALPALSLFGIAAFTLLLPMAYVSAELAQADFRRTLVLVATIMLAGGLLLASTMILVLPTIGGQTRLVAAIWALGALINVSANLWLIPTLGVLGAAMSTVAAYATTAVASVLMMRLSTNRTRTWSVDSSTDSE